MRIAVNGAHLGRTVPELAHAAHRAARDGLHGFWMSQAFGFDALTVLAAAGRDVDGIELGTAVVPIFTRHPEALAATALTVQAATRCPLTLGIGLSHASVVEGRWGHSFARPVDHMCEYLDALLPLLQGQASEARGELVTSVGALDVTDVACPRVLLGALGPRMLELAGARTEGTIVGNAGPRAIREHVVPCLHRGAERAAAGPPRVVAHVPTWVTDNEAEVRSHLAPPLDAYARFPSFRRMLEREGVTSAVDIAVVGDEERVIEQIDQYGDAGVTEFAAVEMAPSGEERERTRELLRSLARGGRSAASVSGAPAEGGPHHGG